MVIQTFKYIDSQLRVVIENNADKLIKAKFSSNEGKTNWLSITEEQFKKIQAILTD